MKGNHPQVKRWHANLKLKIDRFFTWRWLFGTVKYLRNMLQVSRTEWVILEVFSKNPEECLIRSGFITYLFKKKQYT